MATVADPSTATGDQAFFLEEFRRTTIVVALDDLTDLADLPALASLIAELSAHEARVLLVTADAGGADEVATAVGCTYIGPTPDDLSSGPTADFLATLWLALSTDGAVVVASRRESAADDAARLGRRLGTSKVVFTDAAGGWGDPIRSFMTLDELGHANASDSGAIDAAVRYALSGGVTSVNLCRLAALSQELLTFDGAGTLFTTADFLEARPFAIDELPLVEDFVRRGVDDGFLRPRPRRDVARLLSTGMGVHIVGSGHLVGIGGIELAPYADTGVGEIVSLYTVTRFAGEGVGRRLLAALVDRAAEAGRRAVFACTVSDSAQAWFERHGFRLVEVEEIPSAKWIDYEPERRQRVKCLWLDIGG
jgi:amino-acid N-acetyltransferase